MLNSPAELVLIVEDDQRTRDVFARLIAGFGYRVETASSGEAALDSVEMKRPDLVLLDVNLGGISGFDVCRRLKGDARTSLIPVLILTGLTGMADRVSGVEAGANGFLTKPPVFSELEVRIRSLLRVKHLTDGLDSAEAVMISLAEAIESRDPYTMGHCERLATYAVALGTHLGLQAAQLAALRRGGILHDIGKVAIPDAILFKPTALTPAEFAFMQRHTSIGAALCANLKSLDDVCPIIRHHHERADGSGYPDGLKGSAIPLLARIMTIVDAYDAMTTSRPYRPARTPNEAIAELWEDVARGWKDGELVAAFQKVVLATPHLPSGHQFAA